MKTYNARDCVALMQMYPKLCQEVRAKGLWEFYQKEMALAPIVIKAQLKGLNIDQRNLSLWQQWITRELEESKSVLYQKFGLPNRVNLNSQIHKNWILYGIEPEAFNTVDEELKDYNLSFTAHRYRCTKCSRAKSIKIREDETIVKHITITCPKCKEDRLFIYDSIGKLQKMKSKDSANYEKLATILDLRSVVPLAIPTGFTPPQGKNGPSSDSGSLTRYLIAINKRLEDLEKLKRIGERHKKELKDLKRSQQFIALLKKYNAVEKLRSSFFTFKTWSDGKVHTTALIHGTSTARFSYKNPNLQQIPSGKTGQMARACFCAPKGYKLLSVDFSNLEVQVGARIMSDEVLIDQLNKGMNLHDENTKTFFGVEKGTAEFKLLRPVAKMIQFARLFYGGSDRGIYAKAIAQEPECGLTFKGFVNAVKAYEEAHPAYPIWAESVRQLAIKERVAINAYGRKRYLFGSMSQIERQGLNTPIQGTAAEVVQDDMITLDRYFVANGLKTFIPIQIHDELLFCIPEEELPIVWPEIKKVMSRERNINGYKFSIPIDAELGDNWGTMGSFNEATFELEGASKHV